MEKIDPTERLQRKVLSIFREMAGDRSERIDGSRVAKESQELIETSLKEDYGDHIGHEIAFHLVDWNWDAAFLTAIHLFREKFTKEHVEYGVIMVSGHVPNHAARAAKLAGFDVKDIFEPE